MSQHSAGAICASTDRSTSLGSLPSAQGNETKRSPRLPCYILGRRPRNPNFGHTDIMRQIDSSLLPRGSQSRNIGLNTLKSFATCGLGEMRKTQIALEYAYPRRPDFDAIFWVQADTKISISECLATIAVSLEIANESKVSDLAVSFSVVMQWLVDPIKPAARSVMGRPTSSSSEASWLIIFDNTGTMDLISEIWPSTGSGSVLITTRDPAGKDFYLGCGTMLLPLPSSETISLFLNLLNENSEIQHDRDADMLSLLARFGGLPLAIVQVAALIRRRSMTISEFSQVYKRGAQEAGLADYQASQHDGLLNVMSLLDSFNLQESLLRVKCVDPQLDLYPGTTEAYVITRPNLLKAPLITRNLQSKQVELHPLVQEVVQARMTKPQIRVRFSTAVRLIHASWPSEGVKWGHGTSHREQSGRLLSHALRLKTAYEKRLVDLKAQVEWVG
ncbi:MAG: hypothetical protein M1836_001553 [Candelina mexicana]|nr:MAG: hypothetical protein M1836_001553 [Candelina mexicana]